MRLFKTKPLSRDMANKLNLFLEYLNRHRNTKNSAKNATTIAEDINVCLDYFSILLNTLLADGLVKEKKSLRKAMAAEPISEYEITRNGIKYFNHGGYSYKQKTKTTYEEIMRKRRDTNTNFSYLKNYLWLFSVIVISILIGHRSIIIFFKIILEYLK